MDEQETAILFPDLPIVDAIHHLFEQPDRVYGPAEFFADAASGHNIVASVYVEAKTAYLESGPEHMRPLGEVAFAEDQARRFTTDTLDFCSGIIGGSDLRHGGAIGEFLDAACETSPRRFRGIRQGALHSTDAAVTAMMPSLPPAGLLSDSVVRAGLQEVARRGLTFDTAVFHSQLDDVAGLADDMPNLTIVLNHAGLALGMGKTEHQRQAIFLEWREKLREIGRRPNIFCKVSGFGLPFWGFDLDSTGRVNDHVRLANVWEPYVSECIHAFGVERCIMGSNFPPDATVADYGTVWNALKYCVKGASENELERIFAGTARSTYSLV